MRLREDIEHTLRAWNAYEIDRNAPPVVDFDCAPPASAVTPATGRLTVHRDLLALRQRAAAQGDEPLHDRISAHVAYLEALLGARHPLDTYILATQGCSATGWPAEYVTDLGEQARAQVQDLGMAWDTTTADALNEAEEPLDPGEAPDAIRAAAQEYEGAVRTLVDSDAPFNLRIEVVDLDVYWGYWLDGSGARVRLRINRRQARFTKVQAKQFALHEILGHGLQCASYSHLCAAGDVPWVRMTSVHAQQQVLLEGLAQALPLFVTPDDEMLTLRVRLAHYLELVRSELHLLINAGTPVTECVEHARRRVPFWPDEAIAGFLTDRSVDPLLRSYLWAYPAGIDWFVALARDADQQTVADLLRLAYRKPMTPHELHQAWPAGPPIGTAANVRVGSRSPSN